MFELIDVTKKYGHYEALKQLHFTIEPGVTAVVGPNGAGKTTLFGVLTGRLPPTNGRVLFNGRPVDTVRESLGYLFEDPPFYPYLTAETQLRYFNALREHPVEAHDIDTALRQWGIDQPRKRIKEYSLGMRKRLGLAHAFVGRPRIVILDEPFNGLDLEGQQLLEETFASYRSNEKFLIFSSHQLERITLLADRIIILKKGSLVYAGTTEDLARRAHRVVFHLPKAVPTTLLNTSSVVEHGEKGAWVSVTVEKDDVSVFVQELAHHGISPHSSRLVIPEFEQLFQEE